MYSSDIDAIYADIRAGTITSDMVRIVFSKQPQLISMVNSFPNIEDILCPIILPVKDLEKATDVILSHDKLKIISLMAFIPQNADTNVVRKKSTTFTPYHKTIKLTIPKMIKKLGDRLQHLNFTLSVIDSESDNSISININRGILYIGSTNPVPMATKRIFQALSTTGSLRGLITDAKITYNLDEVVAIPELTIIPQASTEDDPIDEYYIEELISKAVNVNIVYTRETIHERYRYSDMIYRGSMSDLKKINVIIPADHAERHIDWNVDLEEIHILVESVADVDNVKYVLEKYQDSDIFYHIHYARTDENEYWKILKNMGDVVFQDIVVTLLPLKI